MNAYRFHVIALPHATTTKAPPWCACAYTQKILNFCKMMHSLGHEVYHYGAEGSKLECTEHIDVISQDEQAIFWQGDRNDRWGKICFEIEWDTNKPYWQLVNSRSIVEIEKRAQPRDFLCLIAGTCQQGIAQHFGKRMLAVEYGIGYRGVFSGYRVFESYSHMHKILGMQNSDPNGRYYDAVIPNYFDPADFEVEPAQHEVGRYVVYLGRMIIRKGLAILQSLLQPLEDRGLTLVCAGQGATEQGPGYLTYENDQRLMGPNLKYLGMIDFDQRRDLLSRARALIAPTIYVEPFGGVAVEAQMCGCPVISTDWGAFTETIEQGVTGYRCHTLREFVRAVDNVPALDRQYIRNRALDRYSTDQVRHMYQEYFDRLYDIWGQGWNTLDEHCKPRSAGD